MRASMRRARAGAIATLAVLATAMPNAAAETIQSALVKAYQNNPQLNAQRAAVRATDEGVPQALSGYRPRVSITSTLGEQYTDATTRTPSVTGFPPRQTTIYTGASGTVTPWSVAVTGQQTLYNGFQTANRTR